jgi:Undecaprenyl-phosphate glucose phosphotransferase
MFREQGQRAPMSLLGAGPSVRANAAAPSAKILLRFSTIPKVAFVMDFVLVVSASVIAGVLYHNLVMRTNGRPSDFFAVGILVFTNVSTLLLTRRDYEPNKLMNFRRQFQDVTSAWLFTCFLLLVVGFALKITDEFSRGATIAFFATGWAVLIVWRRLFASYISRALAEGTFAERKIIVIGEEAQLTASNALFELRRCGYKPLGTFILPEVDIGPRGVTPAMRIALDSAIEMARLEPIEDVFLLIPWDHQRCIEQVLQMLGVLPVPIHLVPDAKVARLLANPVTYLGATWTAEIKRAPLTAAEQFFKRSFDIVVAAVGLVLFSPLLLAVGLAVKFESSGPALFKQTRNGFNGRSFRIYKFRTMRVTEDGPVIRQATRNDPRVTHLGRILRRANIDELPQLINVFLGDMSLVGPRPHAAAHNTEYEKQIANYAYRYHVKPGITGWAQVHGYRGETRNVDAMAKRIEHDLWYINRWSFWLDLRILAKTLVLGIQSSAY